MNITKTIMCSLAFLAVVSAVHGQKKWTLRECIDYAIENNIEVWQYELTVEESEINLRTSRNSRLPNLTAGIGQSFSFGRQASYEDNTYTNSKVSSTSVSASSNTPLFQGGAIRNTIEADKLNLQAAIASLESVKENIELNVAMYYLEVLYRRELLAVYREQLALSEQQLARAEVLVDAGMSPRTELLESRAQVARYMVQVTNAESNVETALLDLQQALNLPGQGIFDIVEPPVEDLIVDRGVLADPYIVYEEALYIKPHIKELEYRVESSRFSAKAVRGGLFPSISFGMSYGTGYNHRFGSTNPDFGWQFHNYGSEQLGINISIPIYNRGVTRSNIRLANLTVRSRELNLANLKQSIYKDIQQAHLSLQNAIAEHASTEMAVESAEEAYKLTDESFSLGKATAIEVAESRSNLITSMSEMVRAKYEYLFRSKVIDFYRGTPIDI